MHWSAKKNQMCCFYLFVFSAAAFISISLLVLSRFSIVEFISMLVSMHNQNGKRKRRHNVEDLCVHPSQRWRWNRVQGCWWAQQVRTRPHPSKSFTTLFSHPLSISLSFRLSFSLLHVCVHQWSVRWDRRVLTDAHSVLAHLTGWYGTCHPDKRERERKRERAKKYVI